MGASRWIAVQRLREAGVEEKIDRSQLSGADDGHEAKGGVACREVRRIELASP